MVNKLVPVSAAVKGPVWLQEQRLSRLAAQCGSLSGSAHWKLVLRKPMYESPYICNFVFTAISMPPFACDMNDAAHLTDLLVHTNFARCELEVG